MIQSNQVCCWKTSTHTPSERRQCTKFPTGNETMDNLNVCVLPTSPRLLQFYFYPFYDSTSWCQTPVVLGPEFWHGSYCKANQAPFDQSLTNHRYLQTNRSLRPVDIWRRSAPTGGPKIIPCPTKQPLPSCVSIVMFPSQSISYPQNVLRITKLTPNWFLSLVLLLLILLRDATVTR